MSLASAALALCLLLYRPIDLSKRSVHAAYTRLNSALPTILHDSSCCAYLTASSLYSADGSTTSELCSMAASGAQVTPSWPVSRILSEDVSESLNKRTHIGKSAFARQPNIPLVWHVLFREVAGALEKIAVRDHAALLGVLALNLCYQRERERQGVRCGVEVPVGD